MKKINCLLYLLLLNVLIFDNSIYAQYRLKGKAKFIELLPENYNLNLPNDFEVITIKTVLEHLTDPLDCIKYLTKTLQIKDNSL